MTDRVDFEAIEADLRSGESPLIDVAMHVPALISEIRRRGEKMAYLAGRCDGAETRFDELSAELAVLRAQRDTLQEEAKGNMAGLLYWNRRQVETAQQYAVDIAARDAIRAERDELRAQRDAALAECDAAVAEYDKAAAEATTRDADSPAAAARRGLAGGAFLMAEAVRAALGVQPEGS